MTYESLIAEMDAKLHFPGLSNTWTMPVENRLDMELTGIKTPVGIKIQGPQLEEIQRIGLARSKRFSAACRARAAVFAERVSQGFYINIDSESRGCGALWTDGRRCADARSRRGSAGTISRPTVNGRERYPISVRYLRDYRNDLDGAAARC